MATNPQPLEVRIHGMGDKHALSSFGSAIRVDFDQVEHDRGIEVFEAPPAAHHKVRFLNWNRSSRKLASLLWYGALPYTLLNAAGEMLSTRREAATVQSWV
ncbi:MAG: hypothetical protein ACRDWY_14855, partial [Actinomycetes bacterium]